MSAKDAESVLGAPGTPLDAAGGQGAAQAAELASRLVPLAMQTLEGILRRPTRQSAAQAKAAQLILDAAASYQPPAVLAPVVPISLEQARAASAELLRRKAGG